MQVGDKALGCDWCLGASYTIQRPRDRRGDLIESEIPRLRVAKKLLATGLTHPGHSVSDCYTRLAKDQIQNPHNLSSVISITAMQIRSSSNGHTMR
jgi:hypothetical protein